MQNHHRQLSEQGHSRGARAGSHSTGGRRAGWLWWARCPAPVAKRAHAGHGLDLTAMFTGAKDRLPRSVTYPSTPAPRRTHPLRARTGLRQPPETALGAPEALRSPELVTQAPNTLSLIGYYSFFMKPSRLLPSSLGKTSAASFCNYTSLVFVRAQEWNLCVAGPQCHLFLLFKM